MPEPLSVIRTSPLPPPAVAISILVAPASMAFSTSSFVALEGLSMTSPAAIWLMRVSESCLMAMIVIFADSLRLRKQKTRAVEICTCFTVPWAFDHFGQHGVKR
ncbi:hypothetical protein D3C78_1242820 [compost metagenome]